MRSSFNRHLPVLAESFAEAVTIAAVVVSLVVLGAVAVAIALIVRRKKKGTLPT